MYMAAQAADSVLQTEESQCFVPPVKAILAISSSEQSPIQAPTWNRLAHILESLTLTHTHVRDDNHTSWGQASDPTHGIEPGHTYTRTINIEVQTVNANVHYSLFPVA